MKTDHWTNIIGPLLAALPDSLESRRRLLLSAEALLPRNHPLRETVEELLSHLDHHIACQMEFAIRDEASRGARAKGRPSDIRKPTGGERTKNA